MEKMTKKYGLWTAIAMVVGVVIGSGVFFKADDVLTLTNGNITIALLAWGIGAFAMIFGSLVFAEYAQRIEKANGIVDYSEVAYGEKFGYLVGWFKGVLYFAPLTAILCWAASMYTLVLFGSSTPDNSSMTWILALFYLIILYVINYFSPIIGGKLQVATTIIKLIPLILIGVVGIFAGLSHGVLVENFVDAAKTITTSSGTLATAVVATAFAYEGWIVALTINGEIKDSKKNLPKALTIGAFVIFAVYVLYFLGIAGVLPTGTIIEEANNSVNHAAIDLFGQFGGTILTVFVIISCLGTLNGLVISNVRVPFSLAIRNQGPLPKLLAIKNEKTDMPPYTTIYALILSLLYFAIWYGSFNNWFGKFIALDEIPIVMVYGIYIFLYVWYMRNFKDLSFFSRFIKPIFAIIGACIILVGGVQKESIGSYLVISVAVLLFGLVFYRKSEAKE